MMRRPRVQILFLVAILLLLAGSLLPHPLSAADEVWRARYWNNPHLSGDPHLKRDEASINHDWGDASPDKTIQSDEFSARWTRTVYLNAGTYRFTATMDDGLRVWIDGALVIDAWQDSQVRTLFVDLPMTTGEHEIEVHYYEAGGVAVAKLWWAPAPTAPQTAQNRWQGFYFNNQDLSGPPAFARADGAIDFNWKTGSPWPGINNDHFSVRWTGLFEHTPGRYQFTILTDDGARLWMDDELLIDAWINNQSATYQAAKELAGGAVPLRLEYFEDTGAALIRLSVQTISPAPLPPAPAVPQPGQAGLEENEAVVSGANWLNVRSTPQVAGNVITAVPRGQLVELSGRYGGWVKVRLPNGIVGWVGSSYLTSGSPLQELPVVQ